MSPLSGMFLITTDKAENYAIFIYEDKNDITVRISDRISYHYEVENNPLNQFANKLFSKQKPTP